MYIYMYVYIYIYIYMYIPVNFGYVHIISSGLKKCTS